MEDIVKKVNLRFLCLISLAGSLLHGQSKDPVPTERMISVEPDVKVQVLDWGGTGRPLIFLTGLGNVSISACRPSAKCKPLRLSVKRG
jgi:hypothetical protein